MIGVFIKWLTGTAIGQGIALAAGAALLSGLLYAGCQVRSCIRHEAEVKAKTAEKTLEVYQADEQSQEKITEMTDEELADFARTGRLPERLQHH